MHQLESVLVGAGAAHHGGDLLQAGGGRGHQDGPELGDPVLAGVNTQGGPVGQHGHRVGGGEGGEERGVVVTCGNRRDYLLGRGELWSIGVPMGTEEI